MTKSYELYYRTGGHVGPFKSITEAVKAARPRANENERWIKIVNRSTGIVVGLVNHDGFADIYSNAWE